MVTHSTTVGTGLARQIALRSPLIPAQGCEEELETMVTHSTTVGTGLARQIAQRSPLIPAQGCAEELETMVTHSTTDSRHWACQSNSSEIPFTSCSDREGCAEELGTMVTHSTTVGIGLASQIVQRSPLFPAQR
jgi:hypothetical protein